MKEIKAWAVVAIESIAEVLGSAFGIVMRAFDYVSGARKTWRDGK